MSRFRILLLVVFVAAVAQGIMLFLASDPFAAYTIDEGALYFGSNIKIEENNSLKVTELIEVRVTGEKIKYGIGRALPKQSVTVSGENRPLEYQVLRTERDGRPVERLEIAKEWGTRLQLYKGEELLAPGTYQFLAVYKIFGHLQSRNGALEMRRFVTGQWLYPLIRIHVAVTFPQSADPQSIVLQPFAILRHEREKPEVTASHFTVERKDLFTFEIKRDRPLYPGDEVAVDLLFEKRSSLYSNPRK